MVFVALGVAGLVWPRSVNERRNDPGYAAGRAFARVFFRQPVIRDTTMSQSHPERSKLHASDDMLATAGPFCPRSRTRMTCGRDRKWTNRRHVDGQKKQGDSDGTPRHARSGCLT